MESHNKNNKSNNNTIYPKEKNIRSIIKNDNIYSDNRQKNPSNNYINKTNEIKRIARKPSDEWRKGDKMLYNYDEGYSYLKNNINDSIVDGK